MFGTTSQLGAHDGLVSRPLGDLLHHCHQFTCALLGFLHSGTSLFGKFGTIDNLTDGVVHGRYRVRRFDLNVVNQRRNFQRRFAGTFREPLDFVRDHHESAPGLTGGSSVHAGVQGKNVCAFGDGVDKIHNPVNFL